MMIELTEIIRGVVNPDAITFKLITINTDRIQTIRLMCRNYWYDKDYTEITMCGGEKINVKQQYKEVTEKTYPIIPKI